MEMQPGVCVYKSSSTLQLHNAMKIAMHGHNFEKKNEKLSREGATFKIL